LNEAAFEDVVVDGGPDGLPLSEEFAGMAGAEAGESGWEIVTGEEEDVSGEVERRVEEGVETDEPTEANEPGDLWRETTDGRYGKAGEKNVESTVAGEVGDVVDGIGFESERAGGVEVQLYRVGGPIERTGWKRVSQVVQYLKNALEVRVDFVHLEIFL
jgi:hypothetical protein